MDKYLVAAGSALTIRIHLVDSFGNVISYVNDDNPDAPLPVLTAEVWPGGNRALLFAASTLWDDPSQGIIVVGLSAAQTAPLASGTYRSRLLLADPALGLLVVWEGSIEIEAAPGIVAPRLVYSSYDDMLDYGGRSWLPHLLLDSDEAGFEEQRASAREWLVKLILDCIRWDSGLPPRSWWDGYGSNFLSCLVNNQLVVESWVREATAKKALSLIAEGQIGTDDSSKQYRSLARFNEQKARAIAVSNTAIINQANGNIWFTVNLSSR